MHSLKLQTLWTRDNVIGTRWTTKKQHNTQQTNQCKQAALFAIDFSTSRFFAFQLPLYTSASFFLPCFSHRRPNKNSRGPGAFFSWCHPWYAPSPWKRTGQTAWSMEELKHLCLCRQTPEFLHWSISLLTGVRLPFITMQFTNHRHIEMIYNVGEHISWDKWPMKYWMASCYPMLEHSIGPQVASCIL